MQLSMWCNNRRRASNILEFESYIEKSGINNPNIKQIMGERT